MVAMVDTHPWIDFEFDLGRIPASTWMLIGEAFSKCEHLVGSPLKPRVAQELLSISLVKGVQATTAIEGNTLNAKQIRARIEQGVKLPISIEYQGVEVDNIARALEGIDAAMMNPSGLPSLTSAELRRLHAEVLKGLDDPPDRVPGEFRTHSVGVGNYPAPPADLVPRMIDELFRWLQVLTATQQDEPAPQRFFKALMGAILAHLYIAWIHPFGDGNGRTARLVEVHFLASSGVVPIVATNLLSDHYNKTRSRYYHQLSMASANTSPYEFISYAVQGLVDELREQIQVVRAHNLGVAWESYVHEAFATQPATDAQARARKLALALPAGSWVTKEEATTLTTEITKIYAVAGPRMPARDLNHLCDLKLAYRSRGRYRSAADRLRAFTPPAGPAEDVEPLKLLDQVVDARAEMMDPLFDWGS